jgi:predicted thioesterase
VDVISRGRHERFVIDADRFTRKAIEKAALARPT